MSTFPGQDEPRAAMRRNTWFAPVQRPVNGTVFVRPPAEVDEDVAQPEEPVTTD